MNDSKSNLQTGKYTDNLKDEFLWSRVITREAIRSEITCTTCLTCCFLSLAGRVNSLGRGILFLPPGEIVDVLTNERSVVVQISTQCEVGTLLQRVAELP